MSRLPWLLSSLLICLLWSITKAQQIILYVPFNSAGLRGNITFIQERPLGVVAISIHITNSASTGSIPQQYEWAIHSYPVFYDLKNACHANELGKAEHDMFRRHGPIQIPPIDNRVQMFMDGEITLRGVKSIWGKSVLLRNTNASAEQRACSNVFGFGGEVRTGLVTLNSPVAGQVMFRENERGETMIFSNLFHTGDEYRPASKHEWKILVTDILDTKRERKCDYLSILLDPDNVYDKDCSTTNHQSCKIGDLTKKHGMLVVGSNNNRYSKSLLIDTNLPLSYLDSDRGLYLVVYDKNNPNKVLACAKMYLVKGREVKAPFNMDSVKGSILFSQRFRTDPTVVTVNLSNLRGRGRWYQIHEYPVPPRTAADDEVCSAQAVGKRFNAFNVNSNTSPPPGLGTNDQYEIGDLSGKYGELPESQDNDKFMGIFADFNLPLFGINSIAGRSIVIYSGDGSRWICANIGYPGPVHTAVATFRYPIVGHVIFRQDKLNPTAETTVFVELSYSDGTANNTENHAWHIHVNEAGRDFYNWSKRCESVGAHFNPFGVGLGRHYVSNCHGENPFRCEVGDLTSKSRKIALAASARRDSTFQNKLFYTDVSLPLSGPNSIVGRSVVVHDDHAPKQRGNRLACATIYMRHPLTAAVREWRTGSSLSSNVSGSLVFHQENEFDSTDGKVEFYGLNFLASGYHIHKVWVPKNKEFPCSSDSVYGHYNPFDVDISVGPAPQVGTTDQYEVGDLSGKHGLLDGKSMQRLEFTDLNLPIHGQYGIIGRSVVIHKKEKAFRWTCGTIKAEERKERVSETIGIASFHDPRHLVAGFIRLRQFEYKDGSLSDTWIEAHLKYPGEHNRNVTNNHEWAIYVNQVGEDAFNKVDSVRCIAGGYRWNPYLVKDDIENYALDCGPHNPLRCTMGDLSGKHQTFSVGGERRVFTDVNLPLIGNYGVLGRSIVIFSKDRSEVPLGCANIKPEFHLVSNIAVKKTPAFTVTKFMRHMIGLLNSSPWLIVADVQATKEILNHECVQMTINFHGTEAHKLQIEFSNLINLGSVKRHTRLGLQTISTFYKPCRTLHELNAGQRLGPFWQTSALLFAVNLPSVVLVLSLLANFYTTWLF